jgi:hypothetical protein
MIVAIVICIGILIYCYFDNAIHPTQESIDCKRKYEDEKLKIEEAKRLLKEFDDMKAKYIALGGIVNF